VTRSILSGEGLKDGASVKLGFINVRSCRQASSLFGKNSSQKIFFLRDLEFITVCNCLFTLPTLVGFDIVKLDFEVGVKIDEADKLFEVTDIDVGEEVEFAFDVKMDQTDELFEVIEI